MDRSLLEEADGFSACGKNLMGEKLGPCPGRAFGIPFSPHQRHSLHLVYRVYSPAGKLGSVKQAASPGLQPEWVWGLEKKEARKHEFATRP